MPKIVINTPAPDFILNNFRGESVQLSNFKGRSNVLLGFQPRFYLTLLPRAYGAVAP